LQNVNSVLRVLLGNLTVSSVTGVVLHSSKVKLNGSTKVDLSDLNNGTYIYKITNKEAVKSGRIVIVE